MKVKKFIFIEALIGDARWHEVTQGESSEVRLKRVEEMWIRYESLCECDEIYNDESLMNRYLEETIYSETI